MKESNRHNPSLKTVCVTLWFNFALKLSTLNSMEIKKKMLPPQIFYGIILNKDILKKSKWPQEFISLILRILQEKRISVATPPPNFSIILVFNN